jgi:hypothetical protein
LAQFINPVGHLLHLLLFESNPFLQQKFLSEPTGVNGQQQFCPAVQKSSVCELLKAMVLSVGQHELLEQDAVEPMHMHVVSPLRQQLNEVSPLSSFTGHFVNLSESQTRQYPGFLASQDTQQFAMVPSALIQRVVAVSLQVNACLSAEQLNTLLSQHFPLQEIRVGELLQSSSQMPLTVHPTLGLQQFTVALPAVSVCLQTGVLPSLLT